MEATINALSHLIEVSGANLSVVVLLFFMLIGIIAFLTVMKNFKDVKILVEEMAAPKPIDKEHVFRQIAATAQIKAALNQTREFLHADRIAIHRFCNGTYDVGGNGFMQCRLDDISLKPGVAFVPPVGENQWAIATFQDFVSPIWADPQHPVTVYRDISEVRTPSMLKFLQENSVETVFAAPILTLQDTPLGILFVQYSHRSIPGVIGLTQETIAKEMEELSTKVAGYLFATQPEN